LTTALSGIISLKLLKWRFRNATPARPVDEYEIVSHQRAFDYSGSLYFKNEVGRDVKCVCSFTDTDFRSQDMPV
jgi:hypothetical protein